MLRSFLVALWLALSVVGSDEGQETIETAEAIEAAEAEDALFGRIWRPRVGQDFQIVLSESVDGDRRHGPITPQYAKIFDVDLFDNSADTIRQLKRSGKKVICYFSAGTSETWRPDFKEFKEVDQAAPLPLWPGERWLDIRSKDVMKIMRARIRYASRKGCDAVDPDNMDGYGNENGGGFKKPLTEQDSVVYMRQLARYSHLYGMSIGLKNAMEIIPHVLRDVEFAVNESCGEEEEACEQYEQMVRPRWGRAKPVFHIEYVERAPSAIGAAKGGNTQTGWSITTAWARNATAEDIRKKLCVKEKPKLSDRMSTVIKVLSLDGWVMECNGNVWQTRGTPIAHNPINQNGTTRGSKSPTATSTKTSRYVDPLYESILKETDEFDHHEFLEMDGQMDGDTSNVKVSRKRKGAAKDRRPSAAYVFR